MGVGHKRRASWVGELVKITVPNSKGPHYPANTQRTYNVVQRCMKVIFTTL